jgi:hypothetical protein
MKRADLCVSFAAAAVFGALLAYPLLGAAKELRYSGKGCSQVMDPAISDGRGHSTPAVTGTFTCPWNDSSDFPALAITALNIELEPGVQGNGKACIDFWNANGGACGPSMGNTKTLSPLLDRWDASNFGHFKFLAGTYRVASLNSLSPIKGIWAFMP